MSKEIIEGNRLIALFDGGVIEKNGPNFYETFTHADMSHMLWEGFYPDSLEYHSSWDWLMPVVGKIYSLREEEAKRLAPIMKGTTWVTRYDERVWGVERELRRVNINKLWLAVVYFIQWYNTQTHE